MTRTTLIAALAALLTTMPSQARGDAEEASVHGLGIAGVARVGDPLSDKTATVPFGGVGARFTYATSDWFAYEAELGVCQGGTASYAGVEFDGDVGDLERKFRLYRASVGATVRLGARFIPTLHLGAGVQGRQFISGYLFENGAPVNDVPTEQALDLVVTAKLGFDYRISSRLVAGLGVEATHGFGESAFDVIGGAMHVAYYWYPRWF